MNSIRDLLVISLTAQYNYILDRYNSKKELDNFENASQFIISCVDSLPFYDTDITHSFTIDFADLGFNNTVAQDCFELYEETRDVLNVRFVTGWSGETLLEKL